MIPADRKIRFGVVGCGHIGKRHAEMIVRNEESDLVALVDKRDASELGIDDYDAPFFNSVEEMLEAVPEIDVVNVCTPNGYHEEHSLASLKAGKHVWCEKPMSTSLADSTAMSIAAGKSSGKTIIG